MGEHKDTMHPHQLILRNKTQFHDSNYPMFQKKEQSEKIAITFTQKRCNSNIMQKISTLYIPYFQAWHHSKMLDTKSKLPGIPPPLPLIRRGQSQRPTKSVRKRPIIEPN